MFPPPAPPPRDPAGIHTVVRQYIHNDDDMSSDGGAVTPPPRPNKRRSSYENVAEFNNSSRPPLQHRDRVRASPRLPEASASWSGDESQCPSRPPLSQNHRPRATPSPCPRVSHDTSWSGDEGSEGNVRRRSQHCRTPRRNMPHSVDPWRASPCLSQCCPSPVPCHWYGATQTWPHFPMHPGNDSLYENEDLHQKICQLENEKEQLALQVNVLTDQVEAQNEKIMELESSLSQSKEQLNSSEALLRKEIAFRSCAESSRLDLISQISSLNLRLTAIENEKKEIEERNRKLENELILTCACLAEKEADLATVKSKLIRNGSITPITDCSSEMDKLKSALSSVMATNDEKEKQIQEMKLSLNRYKKLHELVLANPSRKHSFDLDDVINDFTYDYTLSDKPPPVPRQLQQNLTLLTINEDLQGPTRQSPVFNSIVRESPSPFSSHRSENVDPPTPQKTPPAKRHYSTLPRPHQTDILKQYVPSPTESASPGLKSSQGSHSFHNLHRLEVNPRPPRTKPSGMTFGRGFFKLRLGKRSTSAPELAPEKLEELTAQQQLNNMRTSSPISPISPKTKSKGLKKIFGRVKRSGSDSLNTSTAELKRGGIRATAGPRLGWSEDFKANRNSFRVNKPFSEWDSALICDWLLSIGLNMYVPDCKKWAKKGDQLLKATTADFEKEMNIKNPLHRKKLLLAVSGAKEESGEQVEPAGKIDHQWIVRWLDDIGLPQYKDAFYDGRIDGRMLHHLTMDDLSHLKVTNLLHHISIKTGIQVMRENNFDPHCLKRRSLPDDVMSPSDVSRWTNHRVMEWLRTVDLSEYAPNLRGSGVHGGLMLYEPRFNADLLATLLNIPPNKTLLRRHLSTQFKQLIGADIMQKKREWEAQPLYTPLSPTAKVKTLKRSPFYLVKRKNKSEIDPEDYVCPINYTEQIFGSSILLDRGPNRTEEEKFLMKEMVLKNEKVLATMEASNV